MAFVTATTWANTEVKPDNGEVDSFETHATITPLMSDAGYAVSAAVLTVISVVGVLANFMVMVIVIREKQLRTPLNFVLLNLSCSDMLIAAVGAPMSLAAAIHHQWPFGTYWCVFYGMFMSVAGIASISSLTVLAFLRSIVITCPLRKFELTCGSTVFIAIGVWLYAIAVCAPPLFGWGQYTFEAAHISCSVNWEDPATATYVCYMFIFGLAIPLVTILSSYLCILRVLHQRSKHVKRSAKSHRAQNEIRITMMVGVMVTAFLIAWMPYAVLALIKTAAARTWLAESITPAWSTAPSLFAKCSVTFNPLIYCGLNTQFRAAWMRFLKISPESGGSKVDISTHAVARVSDGSVQYCGVSAYSVVIPTKTRTSSRRSAQSGHVMVKPTPLPLVTPNNGLVDCCQNLQQRDSDPSVDRTSNEHTWDKCSPVSPAIDTLSSHSNPTHLEFAISSKELECPPQVNTKQLKENENLCATKSGDFAVGASPNATCDSQKHESHSLETQLFEKGNLGALFPGNSNQLNPTLLLCSDL